MKPLAYILLILLAVAPCGIAQGAKGLDHKIGELSKKIDSDLSTGTLTQNDADELKREIQHVQSVEQSEPTLTHSTRRDLHEDISKIEKDLARKEAQSKALSSSSPAAGQ